MIAWKEPYELEKLRFGANHFIRSSYIRNRLGLEEKLAW